jgi:hypothetical protein
MGKNSAVQKYGYLIEENFSEEDFFKELLSSCYEKKLLDENVLVKIYYERMEILKVKLKYYTKDESSSVMVETAESILKCIDYTVGIYLKTFKNIELIIEELSHTSLNDMLKLGEDLISKKILESKRLLYKINKNKLKVDNYSYNDTIDYGLALFFEKYDDFFAAHETQGSIDYPLCIDNMNYVGIEYIYNYLKHLELESEFCSKFDISEITKLLSGYDRKSELLLINIFELILINSIGVISCGKDLNSLNISSMDREYIKNKLGKLSLEELKDELLKYAQICCKILEVKREAMITYVEESTLKAASWIKENLKLNKLEAVFISFNENNDEIIEYIDGEKMANSEFKKLSEEIRDCSLIEDKIELIKNNIRSLEDLVDILSADCLFENEYNIYFRSLSEMEAAILSKYICELSFEYDKEWHYEFKKYILRLGEEKQKGINELKERIQL